MKIKNRRRFTRIYIQWGLSLDFGAREYKGYLGNVSLAGLYTEGSFDQSVGDLCTVKLNRHGVYKDTVIRAVASVSRCTESGIALEFLTMKLDSFFFLQSSLLYKAIDPYVFGKEFVINDFFELEKDFVYFKSNKLKRRRHNEALFLRKESNA